MRSVSRALFSAVLAVAFAGCLFVFRDGSIDRVDPAPASADTVQVDVPLKAYFRSGDVLIMDRGARFTPTTVSGWGQRYSLGVLDTVEVAGGWRPPSRVHRVALDSIAAFETYRAETDVGTSVLFSALTTGALAAVTPFIFEAIFGSCPTTYTQGKDGPVLEAESFSNSIVPLFERRDVDRLSATADDDGRVDLEMRNEALETHYLNHLELVAVAHSPEAFAATTPEGRFMLTRDHVTITATTSRANANVAGVLADADGEAYRTAPSTLDGVTPDDPMDHIDLALPHPGADSVGVVLRLRNSLLSTVLFYDFMLAQQGADALDWLGRDLSNLQTVVELGDFYQRRMGLRVAVRDGASYREVGRVREHGPIAWSDVVVPLRAPPGDSLHLRLSFIADAWRVDQVALAMDVEEASPQPVALTEIRVPKHMHPADAMERLAAPDEAYLVTYPGERLRLRFAAPPVAEGQTQTFFLAAQGYYTEWVRGPWIQASERAGPQPFAATDSTLVAAIARWRAVAPELTERFDQSKVPVR